MFGLMFVIQEVYGRLLIFVGVKGQVFRVTGYLVLDYVGGFEFLFYYYYEQWCFFRMYRDVFFFYLQVDGVLCLVDILIDDSYLEVTRVEVAVVVVQVIFLYLFFIQYFSSFLESMEEIVIVFVSELFWVGRDCSGRGFCYSCFQEGIRRFFCILYIFYIEDYKR